MPPASILALWCAELLLVATLARSPRGARLALIVACVALALPAFAAVPPVAVALIALAVLWSAVRASDFVFEPPPTRFLPRLLHLVAVLDTRLLTRAGPRLDGRALLTLLAAISCGVCAVWLLGASADLPPWAHDPSRWLAGGLLALAGLECLASALGVLVAGFGWSAPVLHDSPHLARTVAEFWGQRWNRIVSTMLEARAFRPLARRHPFLGLCAAFVLSAAIHAYLIGFAGGIGAALCWAGFFLVQPPLIALERRLGVRRWPRWAGHAWTVAALGSLSPLMVEPALRVLRL